ncbi:MAG: hypothetical protein U9N81_12395 [Bacillota bacterium]|nr:hypothetical protein [Bacillota bacterium]
MNISRREKILILIAVYLLIGFLGYRYVYSPAGDKVQSLQVEKKQLENQIDLAVQLEGEKNQRIAGIDQELKKYYELEEKVPRERQMVEMVDLLGGMAEDCDVQLQSISFSNTSDSDNLEDQLLAAQNKVTKTMKGTIKGASDISFMLDISGRYYQLLEYLLLLENAPRIISVQAVAMNREQKNEQTGGSNEDTYTYKSVTPPPESPIPKSVMMQQVSGAVNQTTYNDYQPGAEPESSQYDPDNMHMSIELTTYYDTVNPVVDIEQSL